MAVSPTTRRQGSPLWLKIVVGVIGVVLLAGVLFVSTQIFGHIHGEEFSPQTFTRRRFVYYQIPLIRWKVTPIYRDPKAGAVEDHVIAEKLVASANAATTWDLIYTQQGASASRTEGEAQVLAMYLDATDAGSAYIWQKWSEENPKSAAVFWPVVMALAQEGLYLQLPPLFHTARETQSVAELQTRLQAEVTKLYTELAERETRRGNTSRALHWREKSATFTAEPLAKTDLGRQPDGNKAEREPNGNDG